MDRDQPAANMDGESADRARSTEYSDASPFVKLLGTPSRVKILDTLLRRHSSELSAEQISKQAGVSEPAFSRNKDILVELGVIDKKQKGQIAHYSVNTESEIVENLGKAHTELLKYQQQVAWHLNGTDQLLQERLAQWVNELEQLEEDAGLDDQSRETDECDDRTDKAAKKAVLA